MVKILNFQFLSFSEIDDLFCWNFELILIIYFSKILIFIRFKNRVRNEALKGQLLENPLQVFHSWICLVHKVLQTSMACSVCSNLIGGWKKNPPKYCFDDGILYSHEELTSLPYFLRFRTCKPNMPQRFAKLCVPNKTYSPIQWYHADQIVPFPIQISSLRQALGTTQNGQNFLGLPHLWGTINYKYFETNLWTTAANRRYDTLP